MREKCVLALGRAVLGFDVSGRVVFQGDPPSDLPLMWNMFELCVGEMWMVFWC